MSNLDTTIFDRMLNRVWPRRCFVCGEVTGGQAVCPLCAASLPYLPLEHCPLCALPVAGGQICGQCQQKQPHFNATLAVFSYERPISEMVLALKAGKGFQIVDWLAQELVRYIEYTAESLAVDCIVPMPLHARRVRQRGFNQSVELAKRLARVTGLPLYKHAVTRKIDTPHQMGMRMRERRKNVRGAFACAQSFAGLRVLVVDDVMTSGSSLNELAGVLKVAGAVQVINLVVARVI